MEFPKEELLEKYVRIYEQLIAPYEPDFEVAGGTTRYVKFNDAWRGLNPFSKLMISRLTHPKDVFPKEPSAKLAKNADPSNYVNLKYDSDGNLKVARVGEGSANEVAFVYVSNQLTIGYGVDSSSGSVGSYELFNFEWYEYDGDVLSRAWLFKEFQKYPIQLTMNLVRQMMPDRIFCPDKYEYVFRRAEDGLDYVLNHYYRKSQTITYEGHVSEKKLAHLAEQGFRLV